MRKIFTGHDIKSFYSLNIDSGVNSYDFIGQLAQSFVSELRACYDDYLKRPCLVFAGPGYKGALALAVALRLAEQQLSPPSIEVFLIHPNVKIPELSEQMTADLQLNEKVCFSDVVKELTLPSVTEKYIIIDGLFGIGLRSSLHGSGFGKIVEKINKYPTKDIIAIDIPSGVFPDFNLSVHPDCVIRAKYTFALNFPKLSSFFAENRPYFGEQRVLSTEFDADILRQIDSNFIETTEHEVDFSLQNTTLQTNSLDRENILFYGRGRSSLGATILATRSALRCGAFGVECNLPEEYEGLLQTQVPEVSINQQNSLERDEGAVVGYLPTEQHKYPAELYKYKVVGIGCGLLVDAYTPQYLNNLFTMCSEKQVVLTPEAVQVVANEQGLLKVLPREVVFICDANTFDMLTNGDSNTLDEERFKRAIDFAQENNVIVILRREVISTFLPNGSVYFSSDNNLGVTLVGGDYVLLGILSALLNKGYPMATSSVLAPRIMGMACDTYIGQRGKGALLGTDVIDSLPQLFKQIM